MTASVRRPGEGAEPARPPSKPAAVNVAVHHVSSPYATFEYDCITGCAVAPALLTPTGFVMGEGNFRPPQNPHPLTDHQKICC